MPFWEEKISLCQFCAKVSEKDPFKKIYFQTTGLEATMHANRVSSVITTGLEATMHASAGRFAGHVAFTAFCSSTCTAADGN
jgi:hypothetical protein